MNVYKFGGASISDAQKIVNVNNIIKSCDDQLVVVISALGKTTNELEKLLGFFLIADRVGMRETLTNIEYNHKQITNDLSLPESTIEHLLLSLDDMIFGCSLGDRTSRDYDFWYDAIVSYGELLSSTIVCEYLRSQSINSVLIDARGVLITDNKHREANVNIEHSERRFEDILLTLNNPKVLITQGFIGASMDGETTTLGREGSDYSAAIMAVICKSRSLTIWKDVAGVLNADPRYYPDAVLIEQLNYHDAVELAYSGAQIIHPKTIRPLYNNNIALYVRSFVNPSLSGSVINSERSSINVPIIILKRDQILLTISPNDFSFALEESFENIFTLANNYRQKVNMVQNSAVSISIVVDNSRYFDDFLDALRQFYKVAYNEGLELVTVRGDFTTDEVKRLIEAESNEYNIYLSQHTRRLVRLVRKVSSHFSTKR